MYINVLKIYKIKYKFLIILETILCCTAKFASVINMYSNFVRPTTTPAANRHFNSKALSGEEAKRLYIEEIKGAKDPSQLPRDKPQSQHVNKTKTVEEPRLSDKELFLTVQNNDVNTLKAVLDRYPDKINKIDKFGWSLLMIACQANSVETVQELLGRGADVDVRDKAGNSARSLIIKNKNFSLASIFVTHRNSIEIQNVTVDDSKMRTKDKEKYFCETCRNEFQDKQEHMSSTIHNIMSSKHRKLPVNYVIPSSNKGYQIMLKVGWDKESGLGPDGSGKKYPIKTVQKKDRKGLGLGKIKLKNKDECMKDTDKRMTKKRKHIERQFEVNFRREFY
uniref:G-patch domain-containing protein n=2 Tax=Bombyx mori TaxID=7091 RepID=A0A8R2HM35_BOMMO|nr:G patch domain and ankyrin repeat-containing protein 1 homolog [Bombyx mori]